MFSKTLWFTPDLTLVLQDYGTAILFATGPGSVREALADKSGTTLRPTPEFPFSQTPPMGGLGQICSSGAANRMTPLK
jgi:hypothetical protein